jgi:hypothetical protein
MFKIFLATTTTLFVLTNCAHYPDVRPGVEGVHTVIVKAEDENSGARNALNQANDYCKTKKQNAAIISESSEYKGSMDEESYKTAKKVSKAAEVIGPVVWGAGGKRESKAGGVVGVAGAAGDEILGEEYSVKMTFKCQ